MVAYDEIEDGDDVEVRGTATKHQEVPVVASEQPLEGEVSSQTTHAGASADDVEVVVQ